MFNAPEREWRKTFNTLTLITWQIPTPHFLLLRMIRPIRGKNVMVLSTSSVVIWYKAHGHCYLSSGIVSIILALKTTQDTF